MARSGSVLRAILEAGKLLSMPRVVSRLLVVIAVLIFVSGVSFGQDLGSIGGLVGGKKKPRETSKSTPKKSQKFKKKTARKKRSRKVPANSEVASGSTTDPVRLQCGTREPISDAMKLRSFDSAYMAGVSARQSRDYRRGEAALLDALSYRCDVRAFQELGSLYSDEQRWTRAEIAYRGALSIEPSNWRVLTLLSNVLTRPLFIPRLSQRYSEAERLARRAVFLAPKSPEANLQLGEALEVAGNISRETLASYQQALRLSPKWADAHAHLGRLNKKNGRTKEANDNLKAAMSFAGNGASKIVVAEVLQSFGQYVESEQLLRDALSKDQANPLGLQLLGKALVRQQKYKEAETILKKGADFNLESIVPYISLGNFYIQQARFAEAEAALSRAVDLMLPSERAVLAQQFRVLAEAYGRAGRIQDAERIEKQATGMESSPVKKS